MWETLQRTRTDLEREANMGLPESWTELNNNSNHDSKKKSLEVEGRGEEEEELVLGF